MPDLPISRHPLPGSGAAWLDVGVSVVDDPDELFRAVIDGTTWRPQRTWRYERWVEARRRIGRIGPDTPASILDVGTRLGRHYGVDLGRPSLAWYRSGSDLVGYHRDTDMKYLDDTIIALLVLGERRPFVLRPTSASDNSRDVYVEAGCGDVVVMGGTAQRGWLHGVPPAPRIATGRVSVQWRWTSGRGRPETGGSWSAPRQFGRAVSGRIT